MQKPVLAVAIVAAILSGCAFLPEKSPTKLEKSPCACNQVAPRHA